MATKNRSMLWKMVSVNAVLTVIPVLFIGFLALWMFSRFGAELSTFMTKTLEDQALNSIKTGQAADVQVLESVLTNAREDVFALASSASLQSYLAAKNGQSELWNKVSIGQVEAILGGIVRSCDAQQSTQESALEKNLKVAERFSSDAGGLKLSLVSHKWEAVNQFTKAQAPVDLPLLSLGGKDMTPVTEFSTKVPIVDDTAAVCGGVCTIFQRMNSAGDMLRFATNVPKEGGKRAIGTFIPAVNTDGKPNPVISLRHGKENIHRAGVCRGQLVRDRLQANHLGRRQGGRHDLRWHQGAGGQRELGQDDPVHEILRGGACLCR